MWQAHWAISDELFRLQIQNISSRSNFFDDVTRKIGALDFTGMDGRLSAPESDLALFFWRFDKCIVPSGNKLPLVASKKSDRLFWFFLAFSEYLNFKKYQIWKMHNKNVLRRCPQRIHKEFDLILRPLKLCCQEVNALYSPLVAISVIGFQVLIMFLIPAYWNRGYTKGQIISKCLFGVINFL